jgi:NitT/TauT family transport system substrate-binding protein
MKKVISSILVLGLILLSLAGCSSGSKAPETTKATEAAAKKTEPISIKVAAPTGAPTLSMIKMIKEQPALGEQVQVSYESIKSPDLVASRIISGEIDIAVVPTNLAATLYNKGADYKLAAASVWGILYVIGNEKIESWEDLRGKEIHTMGRGLTPDILLRYLLTKNGLDPEKDVKLTYMGEATELASTYIAGKSAISVIPEPALANVMLKKPDTLILLDLQKEWAKLNPDASSYPQASLIIKNDLIEKNPEFVETFLQEYEKSIDWLASNGETAGTYSEDLQTGISKQAVINGLQRSNIYYRDSKDAKEAIDKYMKILLDYSPEVIGGKLPDEGFYLEK